MNLDEKLRIVILKKYEIEKLIKNIMISATGLNLECQSTHNDVIQGKIVNTYRNHVHK